MALNIRNEETENLANELAGLTGQTKTEAVKQALITKINLLKNEKKSSHLANELDDIAKHCGALPILDSRTAEEILYDDNGLPK